MVQGQYRWVIAMRLRGPVGERCSYGRCQALEAATSALLLVNGTAATRATAQCVLDGTGVVAAAVASPVSTPTSCASGSRSVYQPATPSCGASALAALSLRARVAAAGGMGGPSGGKVVSIASEGRARAPAPSAASLDVVGLSPCSHYQRRGLRGRRVGNSRASAISISGMILPTLVSSACF